MALLMDNNAFIMTTSDGFHGFNVGKVDTGSKVGIKRRMLPISIFSSNTKRKGRKEYNHVSHLCFIGSDHRPIVLSTTARPNLNKNLSSRSWFHFENTWASEDDCINIIQSEWQLKHNDPLFNVTQYIGVVANKLSSWIKNIHHRHKKAIINKKKELSLVDANLTQTNCWELIKIEKGLDVLNEKDEKYWASHGKCSWLKLRDKNSATFTSLSSLVKLDYSNDLLTSFPYGHSGPSISHLLFADDSLFFLCASSVQCKRDLKPCLTDLYDQGVVWRVGNGRCISIYGDSWIPLTTGYISSSPRFLEEDATVSALRIDGGGCNVLLVHDMFNPKEAKVILSIPWSLNDTPDKLVWGLENHGFYSVKSSY
uniref:Uncharacterized protein n=1 Tax=Cannabis sativa TaxID=3483 RepID=A0A803Q8Y4_CANSA